MVIFIARNKFTLRDWIKLALLQKEIEKKKRELDNAVREERSSSEIQEIKKEIMRLSVKKIGIEKGKF